MVPIRQRLTRINNVDLKPKRLKYINMSKRNMSKDKQKHDYSQTQGVDMGKNRTKYRLFIRGILGRIARLLNTNTPHQHYINDMLTTSSVL